MKAEQSSDDGQLLTALADGDMSAMRTLYDRHAPWLAVRLARRCNDREVVADVLQDPFVAEWRNASGFRGGGEVAAWLWGIATRRLLSRLLPRLRRGTLEPYRPAVDHGLAGLCPAHPARHARPAGWMTGG